MRLKYYLRGLGMGIIITTLVLMICYKISGPDISDDEIIGQARALGMEFIDTEKSVDSEVPDSSETTEAATAKTKEETKTVTEDNETVEATTEVVNVYRLVITKGDVCRTICEGLQANGVIEDSEALRRYLFEQGIASNLSVGNYDIPFGSSNEEIAEILKQGPIED